MTIREKAIAAIDHAICEPDNALTSQQAVAAFDAVIAVLMEPTDDMQSAALDWSPGRDDIFDKLTARDIWQAMLLKAAQV